MNNRYTSRNNWMLRHRVAMYYIHSTYAGLALFFLYPVIDCIVEHVPYNLPPLENIFSYLWFGFAYAFWMQYWFEKKIGKKNDSQSISEK